MDMFTAKGQRNIIIVLLTIITVILLFPEVVRKAIVEVSATDGKEAQETDNQRRAPEPKIVQRASMASASA